MSKKSLTKLSKVSIPGEGEPQATIQILPRIKTQEDVIHQFFDQMLEMIVDDFVIIEPEELPEEKVETVEFQEDLSSNIKPDESVMNSRMKMSKSKSGSKQLLSKKASSRLNKSELFSLKSSLASSNSMYNVLKEEYDATIVFTNGGIYEGRVRKKIMHGKGKYIWPDGTVYEGDFEDGLANGTGVLTLPDLAYYIGQFRNGFFHGNGFLNIVSTSKFYNGQWRNGKKHGKGWFLYEPNDWYEGGWVENLRHGKGIRCYKNGTKYKGEWYKGKQQGSGTMIWPNNDYYYGRWYEGLMHGTGKYIWKAFTNTALAFPLKNFYYGSWMKGKRCGNGVMHFGARSGAILKGRWDYDFKQGSGYLICGNGMIIYDDNLFDRDKLVEHQSHRIPNFPIFNVAEGVDVGFYIDKIFEKLPDVQYEKLMRLKKHEEKYMRHAIILNLPKLNELYEKYSRIGTNEILNFEPVMVRMFLWQLFKDMDLPLKLNMSLIDIDTILYENPISCMESLHYPFEPIYFWQFLLILIGISLVTCNMEEMYDYPNSGGVSAFIFKKFLEDNVYPLTDSKNYFSSMNLAPINSVYRLYKSHGEPHTARQFLNYTCVKRRRKGPCYFEFKVDRDKPIEIKTGTNVVGLDGDVIFVTEFDRATLPNFDAATESQFGILQIFSGGGAKLQDHRPTFYFYLKCLKTIHAIESSQLDDSSWTQWRILKDFRRLGPRKILECLKTICPVIKPEKDITTIDYPLTFLEFYETLLQCIWVTIDIEMKKEKRQYIQLLEEIRPREVAKKKRNSSRSSKQLKAAKSDLEKLSKSEKKTKGDLDKATKSEKKLKSKKSKH